MTQHYIGLLTKGKSTPTISFLTPGKGLPNMLVLLHLAKEPTEGTYSKRPHNILVLLCQVNIPNTLILLHQVKSHIILEMGNQC